MIAVNSALKQDEIIKDLEAYNENGVSFKFKSKAGIKMLFETNQDDEDAAAALAKKIIKGTDYGQAIFFNSVKA